MSEAGVGDAVCYISRDGQQVGPYTNEQIRAFHADGHIKPGDHLWWPDLGDWTMASNILDFRRYPPPPPPPPQRASPSEKQSFGDNDQDRLGLQVPTAPAHERSLRQQSTTETIVEESGSFKFSTFVFLVLGLFFPLWPITLPLFWFLAYRSYKKPSSRVVRVTTHTDRA